MTRTDKTSSYGLYLQTVRVEKGIPIETVAAATRIRAEILRAIEAEDHRNLPDDVFVKGFLKSFAGAIGADADETLRRFAIRRGFQPQQPLSRISEVPERSGHFWWTLLWVAVLMTGLVVGTVMTYQTMFHQEPDDAAQAPEPAATEEAPPLVENPAPPDAALPKTPAEAAPEAPAAGPSVPETVAAPRPAAYLLEIVCEQDTWLKAIADDAPASQHYLKPGDILHLEADRMFNLLIGNAGGVSLQLNGNPVPVPGRSGEVVNLELP